MGWRNYNEKQDKSFIVHQEIEEVDVGSKMCTIIFANEITIIKLHFEGEDQRDMIQASK